MKKDFLPNQSHSELGSEIVKSKRKLLTSLVCATIGCSLITVLGALNGQVALYSNVLVIVASGSAFFLSLQVVYRQKLRGLFPRLYASLALGLAFWLTAEAIWAYYENVLGVETPFPSLADAFWLAGYVPLFYFLYGIVKHFLSVNKTSLYLPIILSSSIGLILVGNTMYSLYQVADLDSQEGIITYLVSAAYPMADLFLIVPAITAFVQLGKGELTSTPWSYFVLASIIFIAADIGYAYFVHLQLDDALWVWNLLYNVAYLAIASALFWHKSFFTVDEKKLTRAWQQENR